MPGAGVQQVAVSDSALESSGVGVGLGLPDVVVVGDGEAEAGTAGGLRPFFTSVRIFAKSGLPGCTTFEVSGSDRIEPPFWMRSAGRPRRAAPRAGCRC